MGGRCERRRLHSGGGETTVCATRPFTQAPTVVNLLLDSCTFLWLAGGGRKLSAVAASAVRDPSNEVFLSAVSSWEIVVKYGMGRLPLPEPPDRLIPTERRLRGITALAFDEDSAIQGLRLPQLHRDPFDRLLIAQAIALGLAIVTPDPLISQYPVRVIW
jgi:PIN domain nuclease of toxin-antitoxin system